eukprot:SAG11_NODE_18047_length_501_cov_1.246269_1_plen_127_part_01
MTILSTAQMNSFEEQGYVCVDALSTPGGLSPAELTAAEATWDRLVDAGVVGLSNSGPDRPESLAAQARLAADRGFIELMCHPFFENIAKQVLRADRVQVVELGPHNRPVTGHSQPTEAEAAALWRDG